ncbi:MAG: PAS domain-containing protein, partial [Rhodospirillaceae bacterium]|nr:PAS domain-containing protein [Rhodospirillaceae bacterium]
MTTPSPLQQESSAQAAGAGAAKSERDRFVALAFCWADFLLEVDENQKVVFAGGPWQGLVGMTADKMPGMSLKDIILDDDQPLMESLLGVARRKGRIEDVALRFKGKGAAGLPISFAGYFMEDLGRHYFLAMRVSQRQSAGLKPGGHSRVGETNLYDADSFADVLGGKLKAAKGKGDDTKLTMINMPTLAKLEERLEESEATDLKKTLGV